MGGMNLYSRAGRESPIRGDEINIEIEVNKYIAMGYIVHPILLVTLVIPVVP
jgi:hypothetical protein